jgi:hypothetical protein
MAKKKKEKSIARKSHKMGTKIDWASLILGAGGSFIVSNYAATMLKNDKDPKSVMPLIAPIGVIAGASYMKHSSYTAPAISGAVISLLNLLVTTQQIKSVNDSGKKSKLANLLLPTSLNGETDLGFDTGFYGEDDGYSPELIQGMAEASIYGIEEVEINGSVNDPFA